MAGLREYEVDIDGRKAVLRLSDEDAKVYGDAATPVASPSAADTEDADQADKPVANKARWTPRNKSRTTDDK